MLHSMDCIILKVVWLRRYANQGEDKEFLNKVTIQFTDDELKLQKTPYQISCSDEEWRKTTKVKKIVPELVGGRKPNKGREYECEIKYAWSSVESGEYLNAKILKKMGLDKAIK